MNATWSPKRPAWGSSSISSAPAGGGVAKRRADVVDTEGDVMHPRPAADHEAADGRVGAERPEELDTGAPDPQRDRLDSLRGHRLAVLRHGTKKPFIRVHGGLEVDDGVPDMMDVTGPHRARILRDCNPQGGIDGVSRQDQAAGDRRGLDRRREDAGDREGRAAPDAASQPEGRGEGGARRLRPPGLRASSRRRAGRALGRAGVRGSADRRPPVADRGQGAGDRRHQGRRGLRDRRGLGRRGRRAGGIAPASTAFRRGAAAAARPSS